MTVCRYGAFLLQKCVRSAVPELLTIRKTTYPMKKVFIAFLAGTLMILACNNSDTPPPKMDTIQKAPGDTIKMDTLQRTDSIIKG